jgi:hypothetical protein
VERLVDMNTNTTQSKPSSVAQENNQAAPQMQVNPHITKKLPELREVQKVFFLSKLINVIFTLAVVVALPVVYYLGFIDQSWTNRIGIIFNFVAGFMLAPELLGKRRLLRFEVMIEAFLFKINGLMAKATISLRNEVRYIIPRLLIVLEGVWKLSGRDRNR